MGIIERKARKLRIQKIVLETVKIAGMIGVAAVAPKVLGVMKKLNLITHSRQTESIKRTTDTLLKKGMLEYKNDSLCITSRGKGYLFKSLSLGDNKKLNKDKKWDKKWRVLIFDIPENRRFDRTSIRKALVSIGFMRLQNSVWIYPYDCEDLISLLKADTELGEDVLYMIVEALENDEKIKDHFGL